MIPTTLPGFLYLLLASFTVGIGYTAGAWLASKALG